MGEGEGSSAKTIDSRNKLLGDEEYKDEVAELIEIYEQIKKRLVYSNLVTRKEIKSILVKNTFGTTIG